MKYILILFAFIIPSQVPAPSYTEMGISMEVPSGGVILQNISDITLPTTIAGTSNVQLCTQTDWGCVYTSNCGGLNGSPGRLRVTAPVETTYCIFTNGLLWQQNVSLSNGTTTYIIEVGDANGGYGIIHSPATYNDHEIAAYLYVPPSSPLVSGVYSATVNITVDLETYGNCWLP